MNIKLKAIPPTQAAPQYKATIQKSGKIGLSIQTADHFKIYTDKSMELLINEAEPNDTNIYGILKKAGEPNSYKIMKAGDYHSINAKDFLDAIKINYEKEYVGLLVSKIVVEGQEVIKFERAKK